MKKFFLALATVAALAFVGCNKEDNTNSNTENGGNILAGTAWMANYHDGYYSAEVTILFKSDFTFSLTTIEQDEDYSDRYTDKGIYSYDGSSVTLTIVYDDGDSDKLFGTFNGSTMSLFWDDGEQYVGIFRKQ